MEELNPNATCNNLILYDQDGLNNIENFQIVSSTTGSPGDFGIQKIWSRIINASYYTQYSLTLNNVLNYDRSRIVGVIVQVTDSANHVTLNSIQVTVINVPHRPPIFFNLPYILNIEEALPQNTYLMTVTAIDGDRGINSAIYYGFTDSAFNQYFAINSTTGVITIMKVIIRESPDISAVFGQFNLVVIASKNETILSNTSSATISVQIIDINNSPAVFSQNIYNGSVLQNCSIGTVVLVLPQIKITDQDLGINGEFSVEFLNGTSSSIFDIFPYMGNNAVILTLLVKSGQSLDYGKIQSINVTFQTTQMAPVRNISMYSYAKVVISIIPVNQYSPIFINTSYTLNILENSSIFTKVGTIQAIDKDLGVFGTISYYIIDTSNKFAVNVTTGEIFVNVNASKNNNLLDAKIAMNYIFVGQAIDGGGLISFTNISVNIIDINDNPPIFQTKIYYSRMIEKTIPLVPPLLQVQATDADIYPINTIISYILFNITYDSANLLSNFFIDNNTGIVTVVKPINRDTLNQSNNNFVYIFIKAFDPTKIAFFDYCSIHLYVQDVNDNAPILSNIIYNVSIPQNISSNTIILSVNAFDLDQANTINTLITYKLVGNDASSFLIIPYSNGNTGAFILKDSNAVLNVRKYNFTVEAEDHGIPALNGSSLIIINIIGINNRNPEFNQTIFQYTVYENITVGTILGQVIASHSDYNANFIYSILLNTLKALNSSKVEVQNIHNLTTLLTINSSTGYLITTAPLDYEIYVKLEFQVMVVVLAAPTLSQTATATILINILDVNDNPPVFKVNIFYLKLLEDFSIANNVTTGATGLFTLATDNDTVGVLRYNSSEASGTFIVNPVSGEVFLIKELDREKVGFINFNVSVNDGIQTATAFVLVTILDVNDNEPTFNGFPSNMSIRQDTQVGTVIQKFNVTDLDIGENARLAFHINGGEMTQFALTVDGNLSLANSLLQNPSSSYLIFVEVYDNPNGPYHLRSDKQFIVLIILINTPPFFPISSYQYIIPENLMIGFKLEDIKATDNDFGENGKISYYFILPDLNPNPISLTLFNMTVVSNRAQIFVNSSLKYKAANYVIILRAMDNGTPRLDANFTMFINVTSINYYPPNFTNPVVSSFNQSIPTFSIKENIIGIIANITAFDPDEGVNGLVRFTLQPQDYDNANFSIDPMNGTLTNIVLFDRENRSLYKCRIEAHDLGTPSLTSFANIQVTILDVDDNPPMFIGINKTISLSINEGPQVMSNIINTLLYGFKIGSVALAVDYDSSDNNTFCYFMMTNIPVLYLAPSTGDLYGLTAFNVNVNALYKSGIKVIPFAQCNTNNLSFKTNYNASDSSQALLLLQILDINNNPPYFTSSLIIEVIPRFSQPGTHITDFTKYSGDNDTVSQGQLKYFIQGEITISSPLKSQLKDEKFNPIFSLNSSTGKLSVSNDVSFVSTMQGYFYMTIAVNDGKYTNTTSYMTYLVSQSQRLIMMVNDYVPNVTNNTDQISAYFSQQLSAKIVVDGLEICTNNDMNIMVGCTYVYFHGLNTITNMVIDGNNMMSVFQSKSSSMVELNSKFKITYVMFAARNISSFIDSSLLQETIMYRLILIIISGIFIFFLIVIGAVVYVCRLNYKRKIKAYTTSTYDNTTAVKSMALPGTNLYENSKNPFANSEELDKSNTNHIPKKYGIPNFGDGIVLEHSTVSLGRLSDESKVIDSSETSF